MKGAAMSDKKCPNCGYELDLWNDCVSINNILECPECEEHFELKAVTLNIPQLTIPKSIAEIVDKYADEFGFSLIEKDDAFELTVAIDNPVDELESELIYDFADKNPELLVAYLTPLTRDLVKVVEG